MSPARKTSMWARDQAFLDWDCATRGSQPASTANRAAGSHLALPGTLETPARPDGYLQSIQGPVAEARTNLGAV